MKLGAGAATAVVAVLEVAEVVVAMSGYRFKLSIGFVCPNLSHQLMKLNKLSLEILEKVF